MEDDDDYLESLIQENEQMKQQYDKEKAKIKEDADNVIELYRSRYHYILRTETTLHQKKIRVMKKDLVKELTENDEMSKVFRDWCDIDLHNFYFFTHHFLGEIDQAKRFLLDQCFFDVHKIHMKDASGHLQTVLSLVYSELKTREEVYPEKGGFIIDEQDELENERCKTLWARSYMHAFVEGEVKKLICHEEFLEAVSIVSWYRDKTR